MKKIIFLFVGVGIFFACAKSETPFEPQSADVEQQLYELIMQYRQENGLPRIPLSKSLTLVAQTHTKDLVENAPHQSSGCNLHSWSDKGSWKPVCYTSDHANAHLMWSKPKELTSYKGNGYEISAYSSQNISAQQAFELWKSSSGHNAVILNQNIWKNSSWNAIGISIRNGHACVWFGEERDE